jgi:S1-C subfamily serine protease
MLKLLNLLYFIVLFNDLAYSQIPYPELIERIKPSIVGIEAKDDTLLIAPNGDTIKFQSSGSGVIIGPDSINVYALTNEHVVAIKNNNGKTIRLAKEIIVSINCKGRGAFPCTGKIVKVNEKLDLVTLRILFPMGIGDSLNFFPIDYRIWEKESNLLEGENIIYCGFPLNLGRGIINQPLSRTGIISQLPSDSPTFLIDAFVQPGYSGSPVFLIRGSKNRIPTQYFFKFIGICQAYPYS